MTNSNKIRKEKSMNDARDNKLIVFGPVPSRRLGRSLGINNIPPKICSYSCIYCQLGRTLKMRIERERFYTTSEIVREVENRIKRLEEKKERIDFLTFVPDGEPTLDLNLGKHIKALKKIGLKIAVITNASLISDGDVRDDLYNADWVSVKIDAITHEIWWKINRPHGHLNLDNILMGIEEFSEDFGGLLVTETMLVKKLNDNRGELKRIAVYISSIGPHRSYLSVPTRPPAERDVSAPSEYYLYNAYRIFTENNIHTELLIGYEGNAFTFTDNIEEDILSITSVHPMRRDAVLNYLLKAGSSWDIVQKLLDERKLVKLKYNGKDFYMRRLSG